MADTEIAATTHRTWELIDGSKAPDRVMVEVPAGRLSLERTSNPFGHEANWLVLRGTKIGQAEGAWKDWKNGMLNKDGRPIDWGEFSIEVEEK